MCIRDREFERLYKLGNSAAETDPAVLKEAQQELVKLQARDPENLALWRHIGEVSLAAFQDIYQQLGIRFDLTLGESFYHDKLAPIYRDLAGCGLATESEGALVVFHPEHPRFKTQPFIIRKSDGAANYATTDLATLLYRTENLHATDVLYVVDKRQSDHFEQLFLTARKWFEKTGRPLPRLRHLDFGTVLGENGKPLRTKSGDNIRLKELLGEAFERSYRLVTEKNPELPEAERRVIAQIVGVGSVQYADLSQNRSSDYVFSWDKMISSTATPPRTCSMPSHASTASFASWICLPPTPPPRPAPRRLRRRRSWPWPASSCGSPMRWAPRPATSVRISCALISTNSPANSAPSTTPTRLPSWRRRSAPVVCCSAAARCCCWKPGCNSSA